MVAASDWPKPSDTSGLTDADWAELNKLRRAYETGGYEAAWAAFQELLKNDPVRCTRVFGAYNPEKMREALKDAAAAAGVTIEDLRDLRRKFEGSRH
jgi:hypothetical protein